jgi:transposase
MASLPNLSVLTNPALQVRVLGGVDTHADTHTVAAVTDTGVMLGHATFPASPAGYQALLDWLHGWGEVLRVGIEGTGSYGAGLAVHCRQAGLEVAEVSRPARRLRRGRGKSDPVDAENAARAALAGTDLAVPKTRDGLTEALRVLHRTRQSAVTARTAALNAFHQTIITSPANLRAALQQHTTTQQLHRCRQWRPGADLNDPTVATKLALRRLARRIETTKSTRPPPTWTP